MSRRPRPITDYLVGKTSLNTLLSQDKANKALLQRIREKLPSPLAEHCLATLLRDSQLIIYVESSAWSSKLRFLSRNLCRELQASGLQVSKITARVFLKNRPARKNKEIVRKISPDNASLLEQTADAISDPDLSAALKRLGRHTGQR